LGCALFDVFVVVCLGVPCLNPLGCWFVPRVIVVGFVVRRSPHWA